MITPIYRYGQSHTKDICLPVEGSLHVWNLLLAIACGFFFRVINRQFPFGVPVHQTALLGPHREMMPFGMSR